MNARTPAFSNGGAGLTDGSKTVASDAGSQPRGGTTGKAQSERAKRGPRCSDEGTASSARPSGGSHPTRRAKATARLRPARSRRHGDRPREPKGPGAGRPMPLAPALSNQQNFQKTGLRKTMFMQCSEGRLGRKMVVGRIRMVDRITEFEDSQVARLRAEGKPDRHIENMLGLTSGLLARRYLVDRSEADARRKAEEQLKEWRERDARFWQAVSGPRPTLGWRPDGDCVRSRPNDLPLRSAPRRRKPE